MKPSDTLPTLSSSPLAPTQGHDDAVPTGTPTVNQSRTTDAFLRATSPETGAPSTSVQLMPQPGIQAQTLKGSCQNAMHAVQEGFGKAINLFKEFSQNALQAICEGFDKAISSIRQWAEQKWAQVTSACVKFGKQVTSACVKFGKQVTSACVKFGAQLIALAAESVPASVIEQDKPIEAAAEKVKRATK